MQRQKNRDGQSRPVPGGWRRIDRDRQHSRDGGRWRGRSHQGVTSIFGENLRTLVGTRHQTEHCLDDRVARQGNPLVGYSFVQEIVDACLGGRTTQVAQVIGDHPVVLFRHGPVMASEPTLDVADEYFPGIGGQRPGENGVGVSLDDDGPRRVLGEVGIQGLDSLSDLMASRGAPDLEKQSGGGRPISRKKISDRFGS